MGVPVTPGTPITFEQINDDLGVSPVQTTLDLQDAGQQFGLDIDPTNWSDANIGLSMSEFRAGPVAEVANITSVSPASYIFQSLPVGTPNPLSTQGQFLQPAAVGNPNPNPATNPSPAYITAGPHTINFGVTADGNYVIYNALNVPPSPISPASGVNGSPPANNNHTITIPALPYQWNSAANVSPSPFTPLHNASSMYNGFYAIQNRFPTPTAPATVLEGATIRRMYNDKSLTLTTQTVPYQAGTYQVGYIDWRFGLTDWSVSRTAPGNPAGSTAPWVTDQGKGLNGGNQPINSNFYRQPITVTVDTNQSPTTERTTQIYAFLPSAYSGQDVYTEMNKAGNPVNPTNYYYPIEVKQAVNPTSAPTMVITPSPISLDYSGTAVPVTLNVNPNTKTYSVSIVGPNAPNFSFSPTPSPKTGDVTITVGATPYTTASTRTATLRTIIPAPNPVDIVTTDATISQSGISLSVGGYGAPGGTTDPVLYLGKPFTPRPIVTTAPSNAPWSVTKSPFITVPATTTGTGPSPTFGYSVAANPTYDARPGHVTVDFNIGGTPYKTIFTIDQEATPATPEISVSPPELSVPFNGTSTNQPKTISVDTNVPFTVSYTGDTTYIVRTASPTIPATQTSFTVPFGAPSPYVFNFNTPTANDDYAQRGSTFEITSPTGGVGGTPIIISKDLTMARNPTYAYLNFRWPPVGTVTGWSYTPTPAPEGGRLLMPGAGGPASLQIDAHPNLPWNLSIQQPHPTIPVVPNFNGAPIGSTTSGSGPKTWTLPSIPAGPPSGQYSYKFTLADAAADVTLDGTSTSRQVGMVIGTAVPEPVLTITVTPTNISTPSALTPTPISVTGNAPFTKSIAPTYTPWLSVTPTTGQTAGASTSFNIVTQANPSSQRIGYVVVNSPAGNTPITVTQAGFTIPTYTEVFLVAHRSSGTTACSNFLTSIPTSYWVDNGGFNLATEMYSDDSGTLLTTPGYFSDGNIWRRWTGSEFTTEGVCDGGIQ